MIEVDLDDWLTEWCSEHEGGWVLLPDDKTGYAAFLYGGQVGAPCNLDNGAACFAIARHFVAECQQMHGVDTTHLIDDRYAFLPLGLGESSDKWTVRLRQAVPGSASNGFANVPVLGASVDVLLSAAGGLLSLSCTALPELTGFHTLAEWSADSAVVSAGALFLEAHGTDASRVDPARLVIDQVVVGGVRVPQLQWQVEAWLEDGERTVEARAYLFDALDGSLVASDDLFHGFDVTGSVRTLIVSDHLPYWDVANPPDMESVTVPFVEIGWIHDEGGQNQSSGKVYTDSAGNFTIPGVSAAGGIPVKTTIEFDGIWCDVISAFTPPSDFEHVEYLTSDSGVVIDLLNTPDVHTIAESHAYHWWNAMRLWLLDVNPVDTAMDLPGHLYQVNLDPSVGPGGAAQSCGASPFISPIAGTVQGQPGADPRTCPNMAFSSVLAHEFGHTMQVEYGRDVAGKNVLDEGVSDVLAMLFLNDPILAREWSLEDEYARTGENAAAFCGDLFQPCYGDEGGSVYGRPLMGAFWKMHERFRSSLGPVLGGRAADRLLISWLNAYMDLKDSTRIIHHLLALDDDDGNLNNGTPHGADIMLGFVEQGYPLVRPAGVDFSNLTDLDIVEDETGPYTIEVDASATFNSPLTGMDLHYSVAGGVFQSVAMSLKAGTTETYTADIPGPIVSPARIDYYVSATDSNNQSVEWPHTRWVAIDGTFSQSNPPTPPTPPQGLRAERAEPSWEHFYVGEKSVLFEDNFDSAMAPADWEASGPNMGGEGSQHWLYLEPTAIGGSPEPFPWTHPTAAFSGDRVWANGINLSHLGEPSMTLRTKTVDASSVTSSEIVLLRYRRWLTVNKAPKDLAKIAVQESVNDWFPIWKNHRGIPKRDSVQGNWFLHEIDITDSAVLNPTLRVEWTLDAGDDDPYFGGWNIDDVQIVRLKGL